MRLRSAVMILGVLAFAVAARADVSPDPKQAPNGAYALNQRHSQILWAIPHLGITAFNGRFDKLSGTLNFNSGAPEKSAVNITIQTASVNVPNAPLTSELAGAAVFDAQQFPTITFKSTSVERTGPTTGKITGDLTIRGVTKSVTLDASFGGGLPDPVTGEYDLGFHATTTVNRKDFGITGMVWESFVGEQVTISVEAMFTQQKS